MEEKTHLIRLAIKIVIPVLLLLGGLWLLTIRLPGWGIIFGLPMVVIGVVFLIYTYDEVSSGKEHDDIDNTRSENIN